MAHRQHAASDIVPGSAWPCASGVGCAHVLSSAAGYVGFLFTDGAVQAEERLHHDEFRRLYVAPYDARAVRSWFSVCVANLQSFHVFWLPAARKLYARSTRRSVQDAFKPSRGRGGAVPQGAAYIGTYADPCTTEAFLGDLHDALADVGRGQTAAAA
jgi:hypothetical protein